MIKPSSIIQNIILAPLAILILPFSLVGLFLNIFTPTYESLIEAVLGFPSFVLVSIFFLPYLILISALATFTNVIEKRGRLSFYGISIFLALPYGLLFLFFMDLFGFGDVTHFGFFYIIWGSIIAFICGFCLSTLLFFRKGRLILKIFLLSVMFFFIAWGLSAGVNIFRLNLIKTLTEEAIETGDLEFCGRIKSLLIEKTLADGLEFECISDVAVGRNNPEFCLEYLTSSLCFNRYFLRGGDPTLCEKLSFQKDRNSCYYNAIDVFNDF